MSNCRLSAENLACRKGERLLFRALNIDLKSGDALHITGPNGTGKTSLLRILAGLARPYSGEVNRTGSAAFLGEQLALDEQTTLDEALAFWRRLDGAADQAANMQSLGLAALEDVPVQYLSTGQKKRASLARLLAQGAEIWLLDEPMNGLDTAAKRLTEEIITRHLEAGGICLIASHQSLEIPGLKTLAIEELVR